MSSELAATFSRYLTLQQALAPSYVDDASLPPFPGPPASDAELAALAAAIGPLGPSLEAVLRVANGVRKFNLFSVDLLSTTQLASAREDDTRWLGRVLDEVIDDVDDDAELQAMLQALLAANPVVFGAASARADLVLLHRATPDADWAVSQLVNNRWWELPDNTFPTILDWLEALLGGATADAASKAIVMPADR